LAREREGLSLEREVLQHDRQDAVRLAAAQAVELGEQIAMKKAQADETTTRQQRRRSQAKRFAQRTGIAVSEHTQENVREGDASLIAKFLNGNDQPDDDEKDSP